MARHCQLSAAAALVRLAAQRLDDGLPVGGQANEAKYLAAEAAYAAADAAMQTLGGMAFARSMFGVLRRRGYVTRYME